MKYFLVFLMIVLVLSYTGCDDNSKPSGRPNKIVAIMPLSGSISYLGQQEMAGLAVGIDDFNKNRPDQAPEMEIIVEDTQGQTKNAVTIAQKYSQREDVLAMVVTTSSAVQAVAPILEASQIPLAAIASDPGLADQSPVIFRPYMSFETEAEVVSGFIRDKGWKRVAFIRGEAEVFANEVVSMKKHFSQTGIEIAADEAYPLSNRDFRTILKRAASSKPDVIIALCWGFEVGALLEQKRQDPDTSSLPLVGGYAFLTDPAVKDAAKLMEGQYVVAFAAAHKNQRLDSLRERIQKKFGFRPNQFLDFAATYDIPFILGAAMETSNDRKKLTDAVSQLGEFDGVAGTYSFINSKDGRLPLQVMRYENGSLQPVD